jgi:hypothetical protein
MRNVWRKEYRRGNSGDTDVNEEVTIKWCLREKECEL